MSIKIAILQGGNAASILGSLPSKPELVFNLIFLLITIFSIK